MLTLYMAYNGTSVFFDKFCHFSEKTIGKILKFFPSCKFSFFYFLREIFFQFLFLFFKPCIMEQNYHLKSISQLDLHLKS
jgi:hypothetical protein